MCCVDWCGVNLVLKKRQIVCGHNANGLRPFLAKNVVETEGLHSPETWKYVRGVRCSWGCTQSQS